MSRLFILSEIYTNGYRTEVLDIISLIAILCGILVIISKNPIVSVLFLIGLFVSIASFLSMLSFNFIGLSYLLVYVGAVSILFLFILMLINVRVSELLSNTSNSIPLAIIISILFYYSVRQILPYSVYDDITLSNSTLNNILHIDYSTSLNNLFKLSDVQLYNRDVYYATSPI
jgi:NADH-ubiquinone oxidoreductase chain 6